MNTRTPPITYQSGLTLIELMIAVTLGLMLIAAVMGVLLSSNQNYRQDDDLGRMQENGRFIMHKLDEEFGMAGYWGGATYAGGIDKSGITFPTQCGFSLDPANPDTPVITGATPGAFGTCVNFHKTGTPIFVFKRAKGSSAATQVAGNPYIISNDYNARLRIHSPGDVATEPAANEKAREYLINMYYIKDRNKNNDPVPTLYMRRLEIVGGAPQLVEYEAAEGIENIVVNFGIDVNKDGIADYFNDAPTTVELKKAVTARIFILARASGQDVTHKDDIIYNLGTVQVNGNGDQYRRRLFTKTVVMRNTAYMAQLN